jgi:hypothetical protein
MSSPDDARERLLERIAFIARRIGLVESLIRERERDPNPEMLARLKDWHDALWDIRDTLQALDAPPTAEERRMIVSAAQRLGKEAREHADRCLGPNGIKALAKQWEHDAALWDSIVAKFGSGETAPPTPEPEDEEEDEEWVPHPFRAREPFSCWCVDCEYHEESAIHEAFEPVAPPTPEPDK